MSLRTYDLAIQELRHVALVVDLGQAVEDGEPVDLLVILGLNISAGQVAVDAVPDSQIIAVLEQPGRIELLVVHERPIRALLIEDKETFLIGLDAGMAA